MAGHGEPQRTGCTTDGRVGLDDPRHADEELSGERDDIARSVRRIDESAAAYPGDRACGRLGASLGG